MEENNKKGWIFSSTVSYTWRMKFEIRQFKFAISHDETDLHLTFSFTSFKIEFNPSAIRQTTVSKQPLTANIIFQANALIFSSFIE